MQGFSDLDLVPNTESIEDYIAYVDKFEQRATALSSNTLAGRNSPERDRYHSVAPEQDHETVATEIATAPNISTQDGGDGDRDRDAGSHGDGLKVKFANQQRGDHQETDREKFR